MRGVLVVRDGASGEECARWDPQGLEPHEGAFVRDRFVIALGGLLHDGGVKGPIFQPGGVDSAVAEIDPQSGELLARHKLGPGTESLSFRHLAVSPDGSSAVVAMQDQDLTASRPLLGLVEIGRGIEAFALPDRSLRDFRGYIGSVAIDASGAIAAASSPRGGLIGFWSIAGRAWIGAVALADACGLVADRTAGAFWATSGYGALVRLTVDENGPRIAARARTAAGFDNHLLFLEPCNGGA